MSTLTALQQARVTVASDAETLVEAFERGEDIKELLAILTQYLAPSVRKYKAAMTADMAYFAEQRRIAAPFMQNLPRQEIAA